MSVRRRGGSGRGVRRTPVAALVTLACCLLSAPTANADFDDLLDAVIGAAAAGADVDPGGVPIDSADLGDLGVLNDPLSQLDQVLNDPSGAPDTAPDAAPDGTPGAAPDTGQDAGSGNSNSMPGMPKVSVPSSGSGSGGNGGGSGGSGGSSGNGAAKTKANTSATKGLVPQPEVP